jgi:hypothetical protein
VSAVVVVANGVSVHGLGQAYRVAPLDGRVAVSVQR